MFVLFKLTNKRGEEVVESVIKFRKWGKKPLKIKNVLPATWFVSEPELRREFALKMI